jgi:replication factor C large subunit
MTAGVAAARRGEKGGWTRYGPPSYWSKLGRTRGTRETRDYVARQVAESAGTSIGTARREIVPHLAAMTHHCTNRELTIAMTAHYDLKPEHVSLVTGSGEDTNKVQSIVEEARERQEMAAVEGSGGAFAGGRAGDEAETEAEAAPEMESEDAAEEPDESMETATEPAEEDGQQSGLGDFS